MLSEFVLCDVFADEPFAGNPLAVFLNADGISDEVMLSFAREFGWSEVTFVTRSEGGHPRVRIWSPHGELPFAGHPTVGTAVVLAVEGELPKDLAALELGIGSVAVEVLEVNETGGRAAMTQRAPIFGEIYENRILVAEALGLEEGDLARKLPPQAVSTGRTHFMVPVASFAALGRAKVVEEPFARLSEQIACTWLYTFWPEPPGNSAAARARLLGIGAEDAATGSAAGPLGAYLVHHGLQGEGAMLIKQGIEMGRPSHISVEVSRKANQIGPVRVSGQVQIWGRGRADVGKLAAIAR